MKRPREVSIKLPDGVDGVANFGGNLYGLTRNDGVVYIGATTWECPHGWPLIYQDTRVWSLCTLCGSGEEYPQRRITGDTTILLIGMAALVFIALLAVLYGVGVVE